MSDLTEKQLLINADLAIADLIYLNQRMQKTPGLPPADCLDVIGRARDAQGQIRTRLMRQHGVRAFTVAGAINEHKEAS